MITNSQRRARLATRHALAPGTRLSTVEELADTLVALHTTEPPTIHLAAAARTTATVEDVERALYVDRSIVKQLAMRRTLFGFPRDLLPAAWGSTSARGAAEQRRVISRDIEKAGLALDGSRWLDAACAAVRERLADGSALTAKELREQVPEVEGRIEYAVGKSYGGNQPLAPRVLTLLGAEGHIMRAENAGHWRTSRPRWAATTHWLSSVPDRLPPAEGYAVLTRLLTATSSTPPCRLRPRQWQPMASSTWKPPAPGMMRNWPHGAWPCTATSRPVRCMPTCCAGWGRCNCSCFDSCLRLPIKR